MGFLSLVGCDRLRVLFGIVENMPDLHGVVAIEMPAQYVLPASRESSDVTGKISTATFDLEIS
jgi:hypothetical protein